MKFTRSSGVQLHLTSLPGGRLGPQAYRFVDWLEAAGQAWWQVLPLGPPDRAGSPYKARSAFAAWRGLLADPSAPVSDEEAAAFRAKHAAWIDDWAAFAGGARAVNDQVRFDREWGALRAYAAERGVRMIGDVPIYVAPGSADHVAHPELFRDDVVAGAPPDYFSEKGQLWGNPIYDWPALQRRRYGWWVERFRRVFDLFDLARIDHFRGFVAYWSIPRGSADARPGRWGRGPGRAGSWGSCRSSPRTSASSRRRSSGCATRSASPAWSSCSSASTPTTRTARTTRSATARTKCSTRERTTTTRCAGGTRRSRTRGVRGSAMPASTAARRGGT